MAITGLIDLLLFSRPELFDARREHPKGIYIAHFYIFLSMKREICLAILILLGMSYFVQEIAFSSHVSSDRVQSYFSDRLNIEAGAAKNHTQKIHFVGELNVTVPDNFTLRDQNGSPTLSNGNKNLFWNLTSYGTVYYKIESYGNFTSADNGTKRNSEIYSSQVFLDNITFAVIDDSEAADIKIEKGHGDANYFYGSREGGVPYIGNETNSLFSLVRFWNINHRFGHLQNAKDGNVTCTFPNEKILTKGKANSLTCSGSTCNATFYIDEIQNYWWRTAVFAQEFKYSINQTYNISCQNFTYDFPHGKVVVKPFNISLETRDTNPFNITITTNSDGLVYKIKNIEKYTAHDVRFDFSVGTQKQTHSVATLEANEEVEYAVYLEGTSSLALKINYFPAWEITSLKPVEKTLKQTNSFAINSKTANILDISERLIDLNTTVISVNTTVRSINTTVANINLTVANINLTVAHINLTVADINATVYSLKDNSLSISMDPYVQWRPDTNMTVIVAYSTALNSVDIDNHTLDIYMPNGTLFATTNTTKVNDSVAAFTSNTNLTILRNITVNKTRTGLYTFSINLNETTNITLTNGTANYTISRPITSGVYQAELNATYKNNTKYLSKQFRISRGIFDVAIYAKNSPTPGSSLNVDIVVKNRGDFSQDVKIVYSTSVSGTATTEETVLGPALQEETYSRTISIPSGASTGKYKASVNMTYDSTLPDATASAEFEVVSASSAAASSGGGGGSGGGSVVTQFSSTKSLQIIEYPSKTGAHQGEVQTAVVGIKNTGPTKLDNIAMTVSGMDSSWYEVLTAPFSLEGEESGSFVIKFKIPDYAFPKDYSISYIASSSGISDSKDSVISISKGRGFGVTMTDLAVTELITDKRGDVLVTLKNTGDKDSTVSVLLRVPNNWIIDVREYSDNLLPSEEKTYRFKVVPDAKGIYNLVVNYQYGTTIVSKDVFVKVAPFSISNIVAPSVDLDPKTMIGITFAILGTGLGYYVVRYAIRNRKPRFLIPFIPSQKGRIIGIASAKGGVGKTTLVANLAASLAFDGNKVLAVDGSLTNGNLSIPFGLRNPLVTLKDVVEMKAKIQQSIYKHETGVDFIPTPFSLEHPKHYDLGKILSGIRGSYDYVLIDIPTGMEEEAESALKACDEIILAAEPRLGNVVDSFPEIALAQKLKIPVLGIVLNKIKSTGYEIKADEIESQLKYKILAAIPEDAKIGNAESVQKLVVATNPNSSSAKAITVLAKLLQGNVQTENMYAQKAVV